VAGSDDIRVFLAGVRAFHEFGEAELDALAGSLREKALRKGQVLLRMGDTSDEMYVIRRGALVISKPVTGRVEQVLARIGPGDFFGEMALFDHSPRSATVQADSDAQLLVLDRGSLERLTDHSPRAAVAFYRAMVLEFVQRLRASGDLVAEVTRWGLEATGLDVESR
jgi:CRP/FNR family transcriptional regulator, cyclic AMP receptor protein